MRCKLLACILHECVRILRRTGASDWTFIAKSMAVALVDRGTSKLACEDKRELTQAQTVTGLVPLANGQNTCQCRAHWHRVRRTRAICRPASEVREGRAPGAEADNLDPTETFVVQSG